jgi:hypothetical protein
MNLKASRIAAFLTTFGLALSGCVIHSSSSSSRQPKSHGKPAYHDDDSRSAPSSSPGKVVDQTTAGKAVNDDGGGKAVSDVDTDDGDETETSPHKRTGGKKGDGPKRTTPTDDDPRRTTPEGDTDPTRTNGDVENPKIDAGRTRAGAKKNPKKDAGRTTSGDKKTNNASESFDNAN